MWERWLGVGRGFDFSIQYVFWNYLFTIKNLLKLAKCLASQMRIWHLAILTMQILIDIALSVLKIFKLVKTFIFPMKFDTKQAWCKWGQKKQWSCSSKIFYDLLTSLFTFKKLLLSRSFLSRLFDFFFLDASLILKNSQSN